MAHVIHSRRALSETRLFALHASAYPDLDQTAQRRLYAATQAIADIGRPRLSAYERVTDAERILIIGSDANAAPEAFAKAHPEQIRWLHTQGLTLDDAKTRARDWLAAHLKTLHEL